MRELVRLTPAAFMRAGGAVGVFKAASFGSALGRGLIAAAMRAASSSGGRGRGNAVTTLPVGSMAAFSGLPTNKGAGCGPDCSATALITIAPAAPAAKIPTARSENLTGSRGRASFRQLQRAESWSMVVSRDLGTFHHRYLLFICSEFWLRARSILIADSGSVTI